MFWGRKISDEADAYVSRIHFIMLFAASLAGKNKIEFVKAFRDILGIDIPDVEETEQRLWPDQTMKSIAVSFSVEFDKPTMVDQVQITGFEEIYTFHATVNCLTMAEPKRVNFCIDVGGARRTPGKLANVVAEKLMKHSDFDVEDFGGTKLLLQKCRNRKD